MQWTSWSDDQAGGAFLSLPNELFNAWIAWQPDTVGGDQAKFDRVNAIAASLRSDFRQAAAADADPVAAADADLVPDFCVRHCNAMYRYLVAIEIGFADAENYRAAWQDAEVYLRGLYARMKASGAGAAAASPTYSAPRRAAAGAGYSAPAGSGTSYDDGFINPAPPAPIV